jgi:hypothetical protein
MNEISANIMNRKKSNTMRKVVRNECESQQQRRKNNIYKAINTEKEILFHYREFIKGKGHSKMAGSKLKTKNNVKRLKPHFRMLGLQKNAH